MKKNFDYEKFICNLADKDVVGINFASCVNDALRNVGFYVYDGVLRELKDDRKYSENTKFNVGDKIISKHNKEIKYVVKAVRVVNELGEYEYVCENIGDDERFAGKVRSMREYKVDENFELYKEESHKFKIGDNVVGPYFSGQIIAITNDSYLLGGGVGFNFISEDMVHLWTIYDAKNGDYITTSTGAVIIFKCLDENGTVVYHCADHPGYGFDVNNTFENFNGLTYRPSTTKEIHRLQKEMLLNEYDWSESKHEIVKINVSDKKS